MDWHERPAYFVHSTVNSISIGQFFGLKKYKEAKGGGVISRARFYAFCVNALCQRKPGHWETQASIYKFTLTYS